MHIGLWGWQRGANRDFGALLDLFERADQLGFQSIWFNELHFERDELPYPNANLVASAVFARTRQIRVGLAVAVLPIHHPLLLAEELAQLDLQSGGRLDVGIGRGTTGAMQQVFEMDEEERRERFVEAYELLLAAWTSPSVSREGRYWRFDEIPVGPRPVQRPHPPLWVAGYTESTIRFAMERGLPLLLSLEPPEERQMAICRRLAAESGTPLDASGYSLARHIVIDADHCRALERADALRRLLHARRREFAIARGADPDTIVERGLDEFLSTQAVAGDPLACAEQISRLSVDPGVGHLRCVFNGNGALSDAEALTGMELFAKTVLAYVA
jgi:alkanesulfonate monooxygenase SsuD/methylene tetrahydromethanopterin reductase-like flavin-dependent oxidoreductase (luciferase family)